MSKKRTFSEQQESYFEFTDVEDSNKKLKLDKVLKEDNQLISINKPPVLMARTFPEASIIIKNWHDNLIEKGVDINSDQVKKIQDHAYQEWINQKVDIELRLANISISGKKSEGGDQKQVSINDIKDDKKSFKKYWTKKLVNNDDNPLGLNVGTYNNNSSNEENSDHVKSYLNNSDCNASVTLSGSIGNDNDDNDCDGFIM